MRIKELHIPLYFYPLQPYVPSSINTLVHKTGHVLEANTSQAFAVPEKHC